MPCRLPTHTCPSRRSTPPHPAHCNQPTARRFSWNKAQLEKARNEARTQTNPFATAVRGVLGAVPTALLVVASITKLDDTAYNK